MSGDRFQRLRSHPLARLAMGPPGDAAALQARLAQLVVTRRGSPAAFQQDSDGDGPRARDNRAIVGGRMGRDPSMASGVLPKGEITTLEELPDDLKRAAAEAVDRVQGGAGVEDLTREQRRGLEAVVAVSGRPSLVTRAGFPEQGFPPEWRYLDNMKAAISEAAARVGRINVSRGLLPYAGTGFVVGDGLVLTNRHVVEVFGEPGDERRSPDRWRIRDGYRPRIDFGAELIPVAQPVEFPVLGIAFVDPRGEADVALLKVQPRVDGLSLPSPLDLARDRSIGRPGDVVYNVGYPAFDPFADFEVLTRIFGTAFRVKRLAPGELRDGADMPGLEPLPFDLIHDCSTLGGSSGSFLMHVNTGQVIGIHYLGTQFVGNQAVHLADLAGEPYLKDANFQSPPSGPGTDPGAAATG